MKLAKILIVISILFISCKKATIATTLHTEIAIGMGQLINPKAQKTDTLETSNSIVFIAGFDQGNNRYYENATKHFRAKNNTIVEGLYSLEEILNWLSNYNKPLAEIHIVNHSNAWRGMALQTTHNGARVTQQTLLNAIATQQLPKAPATITGQTKIIFHACGLGANPALLNVLQTVFTHTNNPKLIASPYFNVFGGKYASHYLAKPYYVLYPTAQSPGPLALTKEMQQLYPNKNIDWFSALKLREESSLGAPYSYRFNIPVTWQFEFETAKDIPVLISKKDIINFIKKDTALVAAIKTLEIPLEKFRWQAKILENTVTINGKTTVLSVLEPLMNIQDSGTYVMPVVTNKTLYKTL